MKKIKIILLQYPKLYTVIFNLYALFRYPHFFLVGFVLKFNNRKIRYEDLIFSVPRKNTSSFFLGSFYFIGSEEDEILAIDKYIDKNSKVLELGGCLGFISCYLNRKLTNRKNHVVLEGNPQLIPFLERNRENNQCEFNIVNKIISVYKNNTFYIGKSIHSSSIKKGSNEKHNIQGITIAELEKQYKFKFDTLIMDIEGAEYDLFKDTDFSKLNISTIIFELHDFNRVLSTEQVNEIKLNLNKYGYLYKETIGSSQIWKSN
jgi:FkbM family methyltransferase